MAGASTDCLLLLTLQYITVTVACMLEFLFNGLLAQLAQSTVAFTDRIRRALLWWCVCHR